jgi:EAL domain-containing protein (putative c-di-GMP-specific phosphodiesterase class I)
MSILQPENSRTTSKEGEPVNAKQYWIDGPGPSPNAIPNIQLQQELQRAVANSEFFLEFQPIVRLSEKKIVGAEALVRWCHPSRGVIMPNNFIPFAENSGLIVPIGEFVLERACAQLGEWKESSPGPLTLSVNVSSAQLMYGDFVRVVRECLDEYQIERGQLRLEITETADFHDATVAWKRLAELRRMGVPIVLDDFGCGYSSLSRLAAFEVDGLKIDRRFTQALPDDGKTAMILRLIAEFARALNLSLVVEGIETEHQANWLGRLGSRVEAQGYYFSRPVSASNLRSAMTRGLASWDHTCTLQDCTTHRSG